MCGLSVLYVSERIPSSDTSCERMYARQQMGPRLSQRQEVQGRGSAHTADCRICSGISRRSLEVIVGNGARYVVAFQSIGTFSTTTLYFALRASVVHLLLYCLCLQTELKGMGWWMSLLYIYSLNAVLLVYPIWMNHDYNSLNLLSGWEFRAVLVVGRTGGTYRDVATKQRWWQAMFYAMRSNKHLITAFLGASLAAGVVVMQRLYASKQFATQKQFLMALGVVFISLFPCSQVRLLGCLKNLTLQWNHDLIWSPMHTRARKKQSADDLCSCSSRLDFCWRKGCCTFLQ